MRVGILLLNWNAWSVSEECLRSLRELQHPAWKIVVVDNASVDDSADRIAATFPEVELLRQSENVGFAGGNNIGLRYLLDAGAEAVWILNNDTIVDADCLDQLVNALDADAGLGVVTHRIDFIEPAGRLWYAGGEVSPWTLRARHTRMGAPVAQAGETRDVSFVCACSQLVRRHVLEQLGGFHDAFFASSEDVEWSLRATAAGVRMRYLPTARIVHQVSASFKKNTLAGEGGTTSSFSHYLYARNRTYVLRLHGRGLQRLVAWPMWFGFHAYLFLGLLIKGRKRKLQALCCGLRHGLTRPIAPVPPADFCASRIGAVPESWDR